MSRWWGRRATTDEILNLDVRQLVRDARRANLTAFGWMLVSWSDGSNMNATVDLGAARLVLTYQQIGATVAEKHTISLDSTRPYYGGRRWWALCPVCGGRRGILYLHPAGPRCRGCADLVYASTREDALSRAVRWRTRTRARLGAGPCVYEPIPPRPRGQWRRTRDRQLAALTAAEHAVCATVRPMLDAMTARIAGRRGRESADAPRSSGDTESELA